MQGLKLKINAIRIDCKPKPYCKDLDLGKFHSNFGYRYGYICDVRYTVKYTTAGYLNIYLKCDFVKVLSKLDDLIDLFRKRINGCKKTAIQTYSILFKNIQASGYVLGNLSLKKIVPTKYIPYNVAFSDENNGYEMPLKTFTKIDRIAYMTFTVTGVKLKLLHSGHITIVSNDFDKFQEAVVLLRKVIPDITTLC